jgi:hypothetical protein
MRFQLPKKLRKLLLDLRFHYLNRYLSLTSKDGHGGIKIQQAQGDFPRAASNKCTIFASCDSRYYSMYAKAFIGSIMAQAPGHPVHLHIVNPEERILRELGALKQSIPECPISFSWEEVDLSDTEGEEAGIYYYTSRFLRLSQFIAASKTSCLCLDIDALLNNADAGLFFAQLENADIAFYSRFKKFGGSTKLLAGTLFVNNTPAGTNFISNAGRQIDRMISAGYLMEKMDQQILYRNYLDAKREFPKLVFVDMKYPVIDLNFTADGLIWYPKGQSKNEAKYQSRELGYTKAVEARLN